LIDIHGKAIGSEELAASIGPRMTHCIERFGPSRFMFESTFPDDKSPSLIV